jgi:hypothetical protein
MEEPARDLTFIQNWMQSVITHPDGISAGIDSAEARQHIDIATDEIENVITRSKTLTSVERLAVYGNAYFTRLLGCMEDEFPALFTALGEETFHLFAFDYLKTHPSRSYTLAMLGAKFPQFLADTRPERTSSEPDWADFLVDLATLERIYSEVFDGPGVEGQPLLEPGDLQAINPDAWPSVRLVPTVCLRLHSFSFPVHEFITAVRHGNEEATIPELRPTFLAITRREFIVRRIPLTSDEFALLELLVEQEGSVGQAISTIASETTISVDELAARLTDWFRVWAAEGFFQTLAK